KAAQDAGARSGLVYFGNDSVPEVFGKGESVRPIVVRVPVPKTELLLNGATRVGVKMLLNALSTCTMVRLGRVMGNTMVWVVASNLKLIDRATRYVQRLTGLS